MTYDAVLGIHSLEEKPVSIITCEAESRSNTCLYGLTDTCGHPSLSQSRGYLQKLKTTNMSKQYAWRSQMGVLESKLGSKAGCSPNLLSDSGPLRTCFQPSNVTVHTRGESSYKWLSTEAGKESVLRTTRCQMMSVSY